MTAPTIVLIFNKARSGDVIEVSTAKERAAILHRFNQWRKRRPYAADFRLKSQLVDGVYRLTFIGQHPDDVRRAAMIQQYGEPK